MAAAGGGHYDQQSAEGDLGVGGVVQEHGPVSLGVGVARPGGPLCQSDLLDGSGHQGHERTGRGQGRQHGSKIKSHVLWSWVMI